MSITVTYHVARDMYHASIHNILLITSEYQHGNELLVHIKIGKSLGIRLNERFRDLLPQGIQSEQFLFKKTYSQNDSKLITRSTFDTRLSQFDINKTVTEHEILEEYAYTDRNGNPDRVQIVINENFNNMNAVIEFRDMKQYKNFSYPNWLIQGEYSEVL